MSTEITTPKTFEEKIADRIRDSIGELIDEADLKRIIERGIENALFSERVVPNAYNSWQRAVKPSIVDECIQNYLSGRVAAAVDTWLSENPQKIQEALNGAIKLGIAGCVSKALEWKFSSMFDGLIEQMQSRGLIPQQQ